MYDTVSFLVQYPLSIQLPAIQYKVINILKPPKTQVSHVKENITLVKITIQRPFIYYPYHIETESIYQTIVYH
jgi:hypothetical protein